MFSRRTLLVSTAAGLFAPLDPFGRLARPDVVILHTNDMHGRFALPEHQGFAYLAKEMRRMRGERSDALVLDAGDIIHGTPMEQRIGPGPILRAMNTLGYHAATAGNHEFDFGPENLRNAAKIAAFPILSANVRTKDGDPWGPLVPWKILTAGRTRIGLFGLTTTYTPSIQWPRTIEGILFQDPIPHARKCVEELRPQVDLIVCLSHLGYKPDQTLAAEVPGIDLIVGGHSHTRLDKPTVVEGIPIVQTGALGRAFGRLELSRDGKGWRTEYRLVDAETISGKDERAEAAYAPDGKPLDAWLDTRIGTLASSISDVDLTKRATASGLFLAEAVREAAKADVGLYSATQYGGTIAAGPVTRREVYAHTPAYTRQHVVRVEAPAALLRAELGRANREGKWAVHATVIPDRERVVIAGAAHVIQELLYPKPETRVLYDDPLGPSVRDALLAAVAAGKSPR